ncbi:hypothetical protein OG787_32650 [Streptomyces sp. NBC_00075]|uniref:Uncharacterized protein n=1 Tax=Streptomyces sp. NBC_00093 TaxID=2975649 RepID=A0AAU2A7Z2_9ACTN
MAETSDERRGRFRAKKKVRMTFEIQVLDGPEGAQLRREQARVIREVVEWVARQRSDPGSSSAPEPRNPR